MEPTRRSHAYCAIIRHRSRPFLKISLALRKVPLAASEPSGVSAQLGGSSGPHLVASAVGICNNVAGYWHVLGQGGGWRGGWWQLGLACHVEAAWWGLAHRVEAVWRGLAHRVEVTWWGLGCWVGVVDGVGAGGGWALHATLRRRGGSAGSWHAMLGQQGLAHRVGVARWVGGVRVSGQDGGGSCAQMACNVQGFACCVGVAGWWWWCVASHVGQCVGAGTNGSGSCA
ncbi:hypothetical protein EDB89DRAFT_1904251 [Lactarius sanguifluus]|nr:hypothetical protein EDB89DRAFT_1904251 [Lactarius sanguifluus]